MSKELKDKILSAMANHNLTQADIAGATGVTQTTVSSWLQGINPRPAKLKKLNDYLDSIGSKPAATKEIEALFYEIDLELDYIVKPLKGMADPAPSRAIKAGEKLRELKKAVESAFYHAGQGQGHASPADSAPYELEIENAALRAELKARVEEKDAQIASMQKNMALLYSDLERRSANIGEMIRAFGSSDFPGAVASDVLEKFSKAYPRLQETDTPGQRPAKRI
jgi:transcriptional regulator with XRE-family HTH domain